MCQMHDMFQDMIMDVSRTVSTGPSPLRLPHQKFDQYSPSEGGNATLSIEVGSILHSGHVPTSAGVESLQPCELMGKTAKEVYSEQINLQNHDNNIAQDRLSVVTEEKMTSVGGWRLCRWVILLQQKYLVQFPLFL